MQIQNDACCSLSAYFQVRAGELDAFRRLSAQFVEKTKTEAKCLHYAHLFSDHLVYAREGYADAEGVLAHLENVGPLIQKALEISELARLEVHGPAAEVDKLRAPMADLNPQFFALEAGFRR